MKILILHIFLLISIPAFSQTAWTLIDSGTSNNLTDITFTTNSVGYIVGEEGTILKTTDSGNTWSSVFSDNIRDFISLSFYNDDIGYALTTTELYKTIDGGINWLNTYTNSAVNLNVVCFLSANVGFIGTNQSILKTTDGGQNWINEPTNNEIKSISFPTQNAGYFVGGSDVSSLLYKTTDQGLTFSTQVIAIQSIKERVYFIDENIGYIIGWYSPLIKKTTDGGQTWNYLSDENGGMDINFINEQNGFYLQNGGGLCKLFSTTDGGTNWLEELSISNPTSSLYGFSKMTTRDGSIYLVGVNGIIYRKSILLNVKTLNENNKISIFPNPTSKGIINIQYDSDYLHVNSISLINMLGEVIQKFSTNFETLNFDHLSKGVYYLKFETSDGNVSEKILIN